MGAGAAPELNQQLCLQPVRPTGAQRAVRPPALGMAVARRGGPASVTFDSAQ